MERPVPFVSRVRLKNFKSIAECDVRLGPLTVLVGPNGSGKSNFLHALALLGRALNTTPYEAVTGLGGLAEIVRRVPEPAESFSIDVEASYPWGGQWVSAEYGFEIGFAGRRGLRPFEVLRESCELRVVTDVVRFGVSRGADQPKRASRMLGDDSSRRRAQDEVAASVVGCAYARGQRDVAAVAEDGHRVRARGEIGAACHVQGKHARYDDLEVHVRRGSYCRARRFGLQVRFGRGQSRQQQCGGTHQATAAPRPAHVRAPAAWNRSC